jgi:hypothetical protein
LIDNISLRIRIKEDTQVSNAQGKMVLARNFFRDLKPGEYRILSGKRQVFGQFLHVTGLRQDNGDFVIVASTDSPETALEDYGLRWGIETLFGCLKSRGFNFEETHITKPERLSKLMGVLTIAFCLAFYTGEWLAAEKTILLKKHCRKAISIFHYGLRHLKNVFINAFCKLDELNRVFEIFLSKFNTPELLPSNKLE